jgi:hypothetical protein
MYVCMCACVGTVSHGFGPTDPLVVILRVESRALHVRVNLRYKSEPGRPRRAGRRASARYIRALVPMQRLRSSLRL